MEALYFGSAKGGLNHGGTGPGPWIMADLEQGLWGSNITASLEPTISHTFVTALFKGASGSAPGHFALKGGDAQQGPLQVYWDGPRPHGYAPMKKQGALILGIGGDNSDSSEGTFCSFLFSSPLSHHRVDDCAHTIHPHASPSPLPADEGAILSGYTSDATDAALQANIVAAGYAQ